MHAPASLPPTPDQSFAEGEGAVYPLGGDAGRA